MVLMVPLLVPTLVSMTYLCFDGEAHVYPRTYFYHCRCIIGPVVYLVALMGITG